MSMNITVLYKLYYTIIVSHATNKGQGNPTSAFPNFLYRLVQHLLVNGVHTLELCKIIDIKIIP